MKHFLPFAYLFLITNTALAFGVQQVTGKVISFDKDSVVLDSEGKGMVLVPRSFFSKEFRPDSVVSITLNDTQLKSLKKLPSKNSK